MQVFGLGHDLRDGQGGAQNRIIAGKPAIGAIVDAFVGDIERRIEAHGFAKMPSGQCLAAACHRLEFIAGFGGDKLAEALQQRSI